MTHPEQTAPPILEPEVPAPRLPTWAMQLGNLLAEAAALAADHDVDLDAFVRGAWSAYVEARPGLREYLEEMQLRTQLDELRKNGRLGSA